MGKENNPFEEFEPRGYAGDEFSAVDVNLANRNSGLALEMMHHDVTPMGMHYLLSHFDVPVTDADIWALVLDGNFKRPMSLSMDDLKKRDTVTIPVTMECAGNGRATHEKRSVSMPWFYGAVGTSEWTGTPLIDLLEEAGIGEGAVEISFLGADRGFDHAVEHNFGRSLTLKQIANRDILLCHSMNGMALLPQHGFPLRLIVPGWYGMASVKWLNRIEALNEPYQGYQQVGTYRYRQEVGDEGVGVTDIRVKSLMVPPGIPDWYSRRRLVEAGPVEIIGRAWSGAGVGIEKMEFSHDGEIWQEAELLQSVGQYAWRKWKFTWDAKPGEYVLSCRATDANGEIQPLTPPWDAAGFGNNEVHRVRVTVR